MGDIHKLRILKLNSTNNTLEAGIVPDIIFPPPVTSAIYRLDSKSDLERSNVLSEAAYGQTIYPKSYFSITKNKYADQIANQGPCGSCWAQAIASLTSTLYALKYNKLVILNPLQILSCTYQKNCKDLNIDNCGESSKQPMSGCTGGLITTAALYVEKNGLKTGRKFKL